MDIYVQSFLNIGEAKVMVRKEMQVTAKQVKRGLIGVTTRERLTNSTLVINEAGEKVLLFLKSYISQEMIANLTEDVRREKFMTMAKKKKETSRGDVQGVYFGRWEELGQGSYHWTLSTKKEEGKRFIYRNSKVWTRAARALKWLDPQCYEEVQKGKHSLFGRVFSFAVVNLQCKFKLHRDYRDYKWCCIMPFGEFQGGEVELPFLGIEVQAKAGDVLFIRSSKSWHSVKENTGKRGSVVLTTHCNVLQEK